MKKIYALILFMFIIPIPFFQTTNTISSSGGSVSTAIQIQPNTITNGNLTTGSSVYYNITIPGPSNFMVNLSTAGGNQLSLTIYDPHGVVLGTNTSLPYQTLPLNITIGGTYTIKITAVTVTNNYSLGVGPQGPQPGQNLAYAIPLPINTNVTGATPFNYNYNFSISTAGYYLFKAFGNPNAVVIAFYISNSSGHLLTSPVYQDQDYPIQTPVNLTVGTYSLTAYDANSGQGTFKIMFASYTIHSGEDLAHAFNYNMNTTNSGTLPTNHFFNFTVAKTGLYFFNLTAPTNTYYYYYIYNITGHRMNINGTNSYGYPMQLVLNLTVGNYFAVVNSHQGYGNYSFGIYNNPPGVSLSSAIPLPFDKIITGRLPLTQYFEVNVPTNGYFQFNLTTNQYESFSYNIYNSSGSLIASPTSSAYPEDLDMNLNSGVYFVNVIVLSGSPQSFGSFNISVHLFKPGELLFTAIPLPLNTPVPGSTLNSNFYYNLTILTTGNYRVYMNLVANATPVDFSFEVFSSTGVFVGGPQINGFAFPKYADVYLTTGNYYIQFFTGSSPASSQGNFTYLVQIYNPIPGENLANAIQLPLNTSVTGSLINYMVYFNFTVSQAGTYYFYGNASFSISFTIQDSQGNYIYSQLNPSSTLKYNSAFTSGTYFMIVEGNVASAPITLTFSNAPISIQSSSNQTPTSNQSSNSTTTTSQTSTSRTTLTTTPFASIEIILLATVSLAVVALIRRKKH